MKKYLLAALICVFSLGLKAQQPYPELGAKLEEYFTALAGENPSVQSAECDFLIESCRDSLVRQYVTLKIYDHYLKSHIMGDDAVAVHVADKWLLSGKVPMPNDEDLVNVKVFADFNRSSLIGAAAPKATLTAPDGSEVTLPDPGRNSVLYFYDTGCSSCKLESARLSELIADGQYDLQLFAVYVGADASAWEQYRASLPEGTVHLWDPEMKGDWQQKYGVLKTPAMFLVSPDGKILGRGLDTPALRILLSQAYSADSKVYGESGQLARYGQLFSAYGDTLSVKHILQVADYLAERTFGEGDVDSFKQVTGDLLYYLSNQREEVYHDAVVPFVQKYINGLPDVWTGADDKAQVVSLGEMMSELTSRTPVGSVVPDMEVPGTLRRKGCLFRKPTKEGTFVLPKLKGRPGYIVFYTRGCSLCEETLASVDERIAKNRRVKVLLIDMDQILIDHPELGKQLLDTFDLSGMPFVLEVDKKGVIQHRYVVL